MSRERLAKAHADAVDALNDPTTREKIRKSKDTASLKKMCAQELEKLKDGKK